MGGKKERSGWESIPKLSNMAGKGTNEGRAGRRRTRAPARRWGVKIREEKKKIVWYACGNETSRDSRRERKGGFGSKAHVHVRLAGSERVPEVRGLMEVEGKDHVLRTINSITKENQGGVGGKKVGVILEDVNQ